LIVIVIGRKTKVQLS